MSRGRSQNHRNREFGFGHNQLDILGRHEPSRQINQVMRGFGGFGGSMFNDDFFKQDFMMKPFGDPMDRMINFSDMHQKANRGGQPGSYVCQTFVSSSTVGPDGKVNKHSYYENSAGQHRNGKTISQKQQAYKDTSGVNRIAEERMLNNRGHKIVKQKRGNDVEQTNHYYNMEEEDAAKFHGSWKNTDNELKFTENHRNYMRGIQNGRQQPRQLGIGYEPSRQVQKNPRLQSGYRAQGKDDRTAKGSQKSSMVSGSRGSRKY